MSSAIISISGGSDFGIPGTLVASTSAPRSCTTTREEVPQSNRSGRRQQVSAGGSIGHVQIASTDVRGERSGLSAASNNRQTRFHPRLGLRVRLYARRNSSAIGALALRDRLFSRS